MHYRLWILDFKPTHRLMLKTCTIKYCNICENKHADKELLFTCMFIKMVHLFHSSPESGEVF